MRIARLAEITVVMRIARLAEITVVMRIRDHGDTVVAVPERLSDHDILNLASLVLSSAEFSELSDSLDESRERRRERLDAG